MPKRTAKTKAKNVITRSYGGGKSKTIKVPKAPKKKSYKDA